MSTASVEAPKSEPRRRLWSEALTAVVVGIVALAFYLANGDFLPINDAKSAVYLPWSVMQEGNWSFSPEEAPFMFHWQIDTRGGPVLRQFADWDHEFGGIEARRIFDAGAMRVDRPKTYLVPTVRDDVYLSSWGPGPGLCALPVAAVAKWFGAEITARSPALWWLGKWAASLCVAASASFVFLAARFFVGRGPSIVIALGYALGTCVFSTSSQALWQHGPNELFLAMSVFGLIASERTKSATALLTALLCGAALGAATWCRPTSGLLVLSVVVYLAIVDWPRLIAIIVGGLPLGIGMLAYNVHYFDTPLAFGQMMLEHVAEEKTGVTSMWQTPLLEGAAGLLMSPSRGLFVYSPFLLFALPGTYRAWRKKQFRVLRPLSVAVLAIWLVEFKHFDWWGGWSFGYRHIVDTAVLLSLLLVPVAEWLFASRWRMGMFGVCVAWSVLVQVLGAWAYNLSGWNARVAYEVEFYSPPRVVRTLSAEEARKLDEQPATKLSEIYMNVDMPEHRHRLWSIGDSQLLYYWQNFDDARADKKEFMRRWLENPAL